MRANRVASFAPTLYLPIKATRCYLSRVKLAPTWAYTTSVKVDVEIPALSFVYPSSPLPTPILTPSPQGMMTGTTTAPEEMTCIKLGSSGCEKKGDCCNANEYNEKVTCWDERCCSKTGHICRKDK